jgi:hypothetical protein
MSMYFYRRAANHPMVYWLWAVNALASLLFLLAVFFILKTG